MYSFSVCFSGSGSVNVSLLSSLSFYQSLFSPPPSLCLSRPEQSRVQRFPLLTRTSITRACNYLSLKLQTSFFLLLRLTFFSFFFLFFESPILQKRFEYSHVLAKEADHQTGEEKRGVVGRRDMTGGMFFRDLGWR